MKKSFGMFLVIAGMVLGISSSVSAGMNGAESSLYAAASGTFEYNGKSYKAAPEYLSQLASYLNRSDVNLTDAQAESAKSQMYANVAEGVAQGYIVPIDGEAPPVDSPSVEPEIPASKEPQEQPSKAPQTPESKEPQETPSKEPQKGATKESEVPVNPTKYEEADAQEDVDELVEEAKDHLESEISANILELKGLTNEQKKELVERLEQRPEKESAKCVAEYDPKTQKLQVILKDGNTFTWPDDMTDAFMEEKLMPVKVVLIILLILVLVSAIILLVFGCVQLQRKHRPSYSTHKNRKIIRKISDFIFCGGISISLFVLGISLIAETNYMNDHKLVDSLSESGYFQETYGSMIGEVHSILGALEYDEALCDEVLSFDNFSFATRNNLYQKLNGRTSQANFKDTQDKIVELVGNNVNLGVGILTIYQSAVDNIVGEVAYVTRNAYHHQSMEIVAMAVIITVLSIVFMLLSDHYQHRSARRISIGILIAAALQTAFTGWFAITKPYAKCYIKPDYLYLSFERFMNGGVVSMFAAVAVLVFAGALLFVIAQSMKKKVQR